MPSQGEVSGRGRITWNIKLQWLGRPRFVDKWMDGVFSIAIKPDLHVGRIAAVHHSDLVLRIGVKPLVLHLEWRIEQRLRPALPSHRERGSRPFRIAVTDQCRLPELGIA